MKHGKKLSKAQIWNRYWVPAIEIAGGVIGTILLIAAFVVCAGAAVLVA